MAQSGRVIDSLLHKLLALSHHLGPDQTDSLCHPDGIDRNLYMC
jgi:hypothetical protein